MNDYLKQNINKYSPEDLVKGYRLEDDKYVCIYCGKCFDEGLIFSIQDNLYTAKKAVQIHIETDHNGQFNSLINLDSKYTGLSAKQKETLEVMFTNSDIKEVADELATTPSNIRNFKFKNNEKIIQAKIFLSINMLLDEKEEEYKKKKTEDKGNVNNTLGINNIGGFVSKGRIHIK